MNETNLNKLKVLGRDDPAVFAALNRIKQNEYDRDRQDTVMVALAEILVGTNTKAIAMYEQARRESDTLQVVWRNIYMLCLAQGMKVENDNLTGEERVMQYIKALHTLASY